MSKFSTLLGGACILFAAPLAAECDYQPPFEIRMLTQGFEAWKVTTEAMAECGSFSAELSQDAQEKQLAGFEANPSLYHLAGVFNSSMVSLVNNGLTRPMDDLVAEYGQHLNENQLIRVDGEIVAIAMMVNAQHLMVREDIFAELGIEIPTSYAEVLAAAEVIQEAGVVDYPFGGSWETTWLEFVNLYLSYGGGFFDENLMPTVNNENGVAALELMADLTEYMDPEYLVSDSTYVQQQFQQGKIAMANFWASRAAAMDDEQESQVIGKIGLHAAPATIEGGAPAATLWWDGFVLANNVPDEEAEAAFRLALEGIDAGTANAYPEAAIWIVPGYTPGQYAVGAAATAAAGAPPYPASVQMGLMQSAIANNIADFLNGNQEAEETLADIESSYLVSAREAGLID